MNRLFFEIEGEVVAKGRPRLSRYGTYTPKKTKDYEQLVKTNFVKKYRNFKPLEGGLGVHIIVYKKIPKSTTKKDRLKIANEEILPIKKPDIDNLAKSILDALNGIAYLDDSQIVLLSIQKTYSDTPKAVVSITEF